MDNNNIIVSLKFKVISYRVGDNSASDIVRYELHLQFWELDAIWDTTTANYDIQASRQARKEANISNFSVVSRVTAGMYSPMIQVQR